MKSLLFGAIAAATFAGVGYVFGYPDGKAFATGLVVFLGCLASYECGAAA